jgi:hypothetical protein
MDAFGQGSLQAQEGYIVLLSRALKFLIYVRPAFFAPGMEDQLDCLTRLAIGIFNHVGAGDRQFFRNHETCPNSAAIVVQDAENAGFKCCHRSTCSHYMSAR